MQLQRQFLDSLGAAGCELAAIHRNDPATRWLPGHDVTRCKGCVEAIGAPPEFLQDLKFGSLVKIASQRRCPADVERVWPRRFEETTDGLESKAVGAFVRQYFGAGDPTVTP
jgi:hypothetical protein